MNKQFNKKIEEAYENLTSLHEADVPSYEEWLATFKGEEFEKWKASTPNWEAKAQEIYKQFLASGEPSKHHSFSTPRQHMPSDIQKNFIKSGGVGKFMQPGVDKRDTPRALKNLLGMRSQSRANAPWQYTDKPLPTWGGQGHERMLRQRGLLGQGETTDPGPGYKGHNREAWLKQNADNPEYIQQALAHYTAKRQAAIDARTKERAAKQAEVRRRLDALNAAEKARLNKTLPPNLRPKNP